MEMKPIWQSKTFWVNVIALIAMVAQNYVPGFELSAQTQVAILAGINIAVRFFTHGKVTIA